MLTTNKIKTWNPTRNYEFIKSVNYTYCEIIINRGVLIFADFVVQLKHEN
jgi:hypothetical protein